MNDGWTKVKKVKTVNDFININYDDDKNTIKNIVNSGFPPRIEAEIILMLKNTKKKFLYQNYQQSEAQLSGIITEMTRYNTKNQMATNVSNVTFIKWCIECALHDNCEFIFDIIDDERSAVYNFGFLHNDCTLLMYILFFIQVGLCSQSIGIELAIKLIETGKSNHLHKVDNKTAFYYAIRYYHEKVAIEIIKKGLSHIDRCSQHYWYRVISSLPNLAISLIMLGYCDNTFFQKKRNAGSAVAGFNKEETMYEYTKRVYVTERHGSVIHASIIQQLKYASHKNSVVQQISRGRLILALKHYFKEGPYYPVDDTNSIYGKEYRKAMGRLFNK